jgi:hypothetical protein
MFQEFWSPARMGARSLAFCGQTQYTVRTDIRRFCFLIRWLMDTDIFGVEPIAVTYRAGLRSS